MRLTARERAGLEIERSLLIKRLTQANGPDALALRAEINAQIGTINARLGVDRTQRECSLSDCREM